MLLPKRVKYRRVHRGRLTGKAMRGNTITYGDFGLVATEPAWITSNQIEAARSRPPRRPEQQHLMPLAPARMARPMAFFMARRWEMRFSSSSRTGIPVGMPAVRRWAICLSRTRRSATS